MGFLWILNSKRNKTILQLKRCDRTSLLKKLTSDEMEETQGIKLQLTPWASMTQIQLFHIADGIKFLILLRLRTETACVFPSSRPRMSSAI